jgi:hypothetical protein
MHPAPSDITRTYPGGPLQQYRFADSTAFDCFRLETGPTRCILEDLETLAGAGGFPVIERKVSDRSELLRVMSELAEHATGGLRPILHVDAHGSPKDGMLLAPSGDQVGWADVIELLQNLNVATGNNLVSVFALCFGLGSQAGGGGLPCSRALLSTKLFNI